MAIKYKISKAEFEKLSKSEQQNYKLEGDEATLDVEGGEDVSALRGARDREKDERKKAAARVKELEAKLEELETERTEMLSGSIPKADAEKLKKQYEEKITKLTGDMTEAVSTRDAQLSELTLGTVANNLASKLFVSPTLGMPHVQKRLRTEVKDGKMGVIVLDANGQPTDKKPEDLEKEFLANPEFKPILAASRGSGSGANGNNRNGGAGSGGKTATRSDFDAMDQVQRAAFSKEGGTLTD